MSLILEALRKVERDRPRTGDPNGVVLLAPKTWPERAGAWRRWAIVTGAVAVLAAGAGLGLWLLRRPDAPAGPAWRPPALTTTAEPSPTPEPTGEAPAIAAEGAAPPTHRLAAPAAGPTGAPAAKTKDRPWESPQTTPTPAGPAFQLSAIGDRDGEPVAIINDRLVRVGDAIAGARIIAIDAAQVELEHPDGRRQIVGF